MSDQVIELVVLVSIKISITKHNSTDTKPKT